MIKSYLKEELIKKIDKNFGFQENVYEFKSYLFGDFKSLVFEINNCLVFEFFNASLTLTNFLLERLLKTSLIYNETGFNSAAIEQWDNLFTGPSDKYSSKHLAESIDHCRKSELISEIDKNFLYDIIRNLMRNGFSHADPSLIFGLVPEDKVVFQGSFINPEVLTKVSINFKKIPVFQGIEMNSFATLNAAPYFNYVLDLIFKIEENIIQKRCI